MVGHLLFAYDSLLLFKTNMENAMEIRDVLQTSCRASGQQINLEKSSIHFAKGYRQETRDAIKATLDVNNESLSEKYLGMPSDVGSSTNGAFKYLKDRVWKRVQGWMEQCLSQGGKEVLIKSVAQAIPTYSMSCFKLPRGLCLHINSLLRNFWWGSSEGKRTLLQKHWFVPVGKPLLSRFPNRERQAGTKGGALLSRVWQRDKKHHFVHFFFYSSFLNCFSISIILLHFN